jgi:cyclopropane fatty-acyl-phospholipid synthase-like methyltransferase
MAAYTRLSPKIEFLEEFDGVRRLLDVGGGDATTAIRMCDRYPRLEVIVLETPSVCAIGRRNVVERGLTDRISFIEADMFGDEWPSGMDGVLFSHVVEIFCPERVHVLYRKAQSSLSSGGVLFVWTIMANDDETAGLQAAKSSTYFLSTASGEGMAYPAREHVEWLAALGYRDIKRYDHPSIEHGAIVAHFG